MDVVTSKDEFVETATAAPADARVPVELRVQAADPYDAYRRARYGTGGFYTATNDGREGTGRFGLQPIRRAEVSALPGGGQPDTFGSLTEQVETATLTRGGCDVAFPCGVVGWLAYDVVREIADVPDRTVRERHLPRAQFAVYDTVVSWEEPRESPVTLRITACPRIDGREYGVDAADDRERYAAVYEAGIDRARTVAERIRTGEPTVGPPPRSDGVIPFESLDGKQAYERQVEEMIDRIRRGDAEKLVASHHLSAPAAVHPVAVFDALREINPAPFATLIEFPGVDLISANMQVLLDTHHGDAEMVFYSGTHPRGEGDEDERRREAIRQSEKYADEHRRLVDPLSESMTQVCAPGTVQTTDHPEVEAYSEVFHLVSRVEGTLAEDATPVDGTRAVIPGPEAGIPEPAAFHQVEAVQRRKRGPYTGAIGLFGFDDFSRLGTIIRTIVRTDDRFYLGTGGGITTKSNPEWEFAETINKARALVNAVRQAAPDGTDVFVAESFEQKSTTRE